MACGLGILHRQYVHRGGRRDTHRWICAAGRRALGAANGIVRGVGVATHLGGRFDECLSMDGVRYYSGINSRRLGRGGFLPRDVRMVARPVLKTAGRR